MNHNYITWLEGTKDSLKSLFHIVKADLPSQLRATGTLQHTALSLRCTWTNLAVQWLMPLLLTALTQGKQKIMLLSSISASQYVKHEYLIRNFKKGLACSNLSSLYRMIYQDSKEPSEFYNTFLLYLDATGQMWQLNGWHRVYKWFLELCYVKENWREMLSSIWQLHTPSMEV